jgi:hypothetical protein
MFFDNNFLFFVTVTATLDDSRKLDSSPLKLFSQMNGNLVGSIYGKSSVVIAHFVPIP